MSRPSARDRWHLLIVFIWPFLFLWAYVFKQLSVGNDFYVLYYNYKIYFIAALAEGHFPLWSPSEAAGYPLFANPFVQALYPLNLVYLAYYLVFGGLTGWDYTLFTILALSIYGMGLYLWLRKLSIAAPVVLATVLITLMSLKLTELLRFPNALHAAAWMPWMLFAITLAADRARLVAGAVIFGVSSLMLLTAGYPYYVVYSVFLFGPYFLAMLFAPTRAAFLGAAPERPTPPLLLIAAIGGAFALAAGLAFPWLRNVQNLMAQTYARAAPDYAWATELPFNIKDTIGSWIFPPAASMEGWYYFGIFTTILIAAYLLGLLTAVNRSARERRLVLMILPWLLLVIYFTWGRDSVIFEWVWHHTPVLDQMRVWGRMNIILVPVIALLLALALRHLLKTLLLIRARFLSPAVIFLGSVAGLAAVIVAAQAYMYRNHIVSIYWDFYFKNGAAPSAYSDRGFAWPLVEQFDERFFMAMTLVAGATLFTMAFLARGWSLRTVRNGALIAAVIVSIIDLYVVSNFQWIYPFVDQKREPFPVIKALAENLKKPRLFASGTIIGPSNPVANAGLIDNWYFARHAGFYLQYFNGDGSPKPGVAAGQLAAVTRLFGADQRAEHFFFSARLDHASPVEFMADVDETLSAAHPSIDIRRYNGDVLELTLRAEQPRWLSFIDNWDPNWTATVDGRAVPVELLFGSYKAIRVPAGVSAVVFTYRPQLWFYGF